MRAASGKCKINGVHITNVEIENAIHSSGSPRGFFSNNMSAVYATVEVDGDPPTVRHTHGKCTAVSRNWSKQTKDLLTQLLSSMEHDLLSQHFDEGTSEVGYARIETGRDEEAEQI